MSQIKNNLILKCSAMSFSELQSLRSLTAEVYNNFTSTADSNDDAEGFVTEGKKYLTILDKIIEQRVIGFITAE